MMKSIMNHPSPIPTSHRLLSSSSPSSSPPPLLSTMQPCCIERSLTFDEDDDEVMVGTPQPHSNHDFCRTDYKDDYYYYQQNHCGRDHHHHQYMYNEHNNSLYQSYDSVDICNDIATSHYNVIKTRDNIMELENPYPHSFQRATSRAIKQKTSSTMNHTNTNHMNWLQVAFVPPNAKSIFQHKRKNSSVRTTTTTSTPVHQHHKYHHEGSKTTMPTSMTCCTSITNVTDSSISSSSLASLASSTSFSCSSSCSSSSSSCSVCSLDDLVSDSDTPEVFFQKVRYVTRKILSLPRKNTKSSGKKDYEEMEKQVVSFRITEKDGRSQPLIQQHHEQNQQQQQNQDKNNSNRNFNNNVILHQDQDDDDNIDVSCIIKDDDHVGFEILMSS